MDPQQEHTWPDLEQLGSDKRDLADEAMYRSLKSKLFDEAYPPVQIGRFRVLQTLGQGGMGVVYSAQDLQLGRLVAIKVIRDDRLREGAKDRARLLREAQMQAKLSHPNVVQIHEVSESEGGLFIVMELVKGATLREWLDREPRPLAAILERFVEAARGLSAAHQAGIVHRDFKLANAMVGEDGRVRIADFGLAVADQSQQETEPERTAGPAAAGHTSKHAGTPTYMSPEQVRGRDCDARSDQYSFAVALTEALFRRPPPPAIERLADRTGALALPADPPAPQWLRQALTRALSLDPAARFPSMAALIDVLVETPKRRKRRALAAGLVVALAGSTALGATLFAREHTKSQCSQDENSLASLWNDTSRQTLHAAFTATGLPYAEGSERRTVAGLDKYAEDWAAVSRENCRAFRPAGAPSQHLFERSQACLDNRRVAFETLLAAFSAPGTSFVPEAETLVSGLPTPSDCRLTTLMNTPGPVERTDPGVRELLDRSRLLMDTLRGGAAVALLTDALPKIAGAGDIGDEAEALLLLGRAQGRLLGDGQGAIRSLHDALDHATLANRSALLWQIWNELAYVHAVVFDSPTEARRSLRHARSGRPSDSQAADAALSAVESDIMIAEGKLAEAVKLRRSSLAVLQSTYPANHPEVVLARLSLAAALGEAEQTEEARAQHVQLLQELQQEYGPEHPYPARVELNLGLDLVELERFAEARQHLEHARLALMRTYGDIHLWVAKAELTLSQLDLAEGAVQPAIAGAERALAAYDALVPRAHIERIMALAQLSDAYATEGRNDRVLAINREILGIQDADPMRKGLDLPGLLTNVGESLCALGRCSEALPYYMRLMMLYSEKTPPEPALQAVPLRGIGLAHMTADAHDLALPFLVRALKILEHAPHEREGVSDLLAATMRDLADVFTALRREPQRTRELRRRAAELASTP